jgi:hypothetical protein
MPTAAIKVDVTAEDILAVFRLPPSDRPDRAATDPLSRDDLLHRAGQEASKRRSGLNPGPAWRHANKARASTVIDRLVEQGRLISGPPELFGRGARAKTVYATPEVTVWHRQRHYDRLDQQARAQAEVDSIRALIDLHSDEYQALFRDRYEAPDYPVEIQPTEIPA